MDAPSSLRILKDRAASVRTVSATAQIMLRDANGESITLDGALAAKNPGWLRLRAWKFNTAAFDLTLTPDGLWIQTAEESPTAARKAPANFTAAQLARAWALFNGGYFSESPAEVPEKLRTKPITYIRHDAATGMKIACKVDRTTLTPQEFTLHNAAREVVYNLRLERYQMVNDIAWPHRIMMESDFGRVVIDLDDVVLNEEPATGAFTPPRRAVKQP